MIQVNGLTKRFGDFPAISGLDCTIPEGCVYGLVGANGAGKSTLLRLICGIYRPDKGNVTLDGKNIFYEGIVSLGSEDSEEFRNVYEEVSKYHVIVPEGTQTVDITYGKDVDIYHADATAYGYETDLAADAVSSATIRSVTLESSYKANDDGSLVLIQAAIFRVGVFYISSQRLQIVGVAFLRAGQCHGHSKPVADGSACGELLLILQKLSLLPAQGGHSLRALGDFRIQRRLGFRESHCGDQKQYAEQHRYQFRSFFHAAASKIRFISLWQ